MNRSAKMLSKSRNSIFVLLMSLILSSCGSVSFENLSARRASPESIQESLRERAYSLWDQKFIINNGSNEVNSTVGFDSNTSLDTAPEVDNSAPPGVDINMWRTEISEPWAEIPTDKFQVMCDLWFSWLMDPNQLDGNLKRSFATLRQNLQQISLIPYSYDQVTLIQDNRKTIPYPKEGVPSYLVTCRAEVTFETTFGAFNRVYVYLSAIYELRNGEATFIFPSYSSKNIESK